MVIFCKWLVFLFVEHTTKKKSCFFFFSDLPLLKYFGSYKETAFSKANLLLKLCKKTTRSTIIIMNINHHQHF